MVKQQSRDSERFCLRLQSKQIRRAPSGQRVVTPVGGAPPSLGRGWYQYGMAVLAGAGQPFYAVRTQDEDGAVVSAEVQV